MGRYLIRRILFVILVLFIVSLITFLIFMKLPAGDPARRLAGRQVTPQTLEDIRHSIGLDQPLYIQYARFAKGLVPWPGWFLNEQVYYSWANNVPVKDEIFARLPKTIVLAVGASVIWLAIGIPIGVISAIRPRSIFDRAGMIFALVGVSAPIFWLAYLMLFVFWYKLQWLPGINIPTDETLWEAILNRRFVLPWFALALTFAAFYVRMVRGNLIETMNEDYIRTARAKGLSERVVITRHGLRSALTPVVTMFGLDIATLLGGAVITETIFAIPGIGQYTLLSVTGGNFPGVMGVTVLAAFFIVTANLVVDIVYAFLDPRVRYT
jgi:peptide/nickel transport system permease protein